MRSTLNPDTSAQDRKAVTELASDTVGLVEHVQETGQPLVLTTEGREVAVLLSFEAFEAMRAVAVNPRLQQAVDEAERGIAEGRWVDHSEVEAKLKHWAVGGK